MEELEPFVEKPSDPLVSVSISEATFSWDKVHVSFLTGYRYKCRTYHRKHVIT